MKVNEKISLFNELTIEESAIVTGGTVRDTGLEMAIGIGRSSSSQTGTNPNPNPNPAATPFLVLPTGIAVQNIGA